MISIASSVRAPRLAQSVPVTAKSSGQGESPTPSPSRSRVSTATEQADFATSTGERIGSFSTNVVKRSRSVTAPSAAHSANGSRNGASARNSRFPSAVYGYLLSETSG